MTDEPNPCTVDGIGKEEVYGTPTITRSAGIPITVGQACYGFAGGGYTGASDDLDATVQRAAELLAGAYDLDVTIRFNSDRMSGGAWLVTHEVDSVGANTEIGLRATLVTEHSENQRRAVYERHSWDDYQPQNPGVYISVYISTQSARPGVVTDGRSYYLGGFASLEDALTFVLANGTIPSKGS